MACRKHRAKLIRPVTAEVQHKPKEETMPQATEHLLFGVDSTTEATDLLQNNISLFQWVVRNKLYPAFWGRNIVGENPLTTQEIDSLHEHGCKIAAVLEVAKEKNTAAQGKDAALAALDAAFRLRIPIGTALFLKIEETQNATRDYMKGFALTVLEANYTPGFIANTDAKYSFDREFSRGMQTDRDIFTRCMVWATAPSLKEYERVTTTHLIHPDNWVPFAPSGITRKEIAIWQYGRQCHPIYDDKEKEVTFNINLVRNKNVIKEKMF